MPPPKEQASQGGQPQDQADEENLQKQIAAARKVVDSQSTAAILKQKAMKAVNPKERMRLLQEAYHKEVEAHGESKYAKRLQSGPWQGGTAGGGIGAGVAMGLGGVVGTLVSGVAAVPTVLVGGLVGAGIGGVHGPWFTFGKGKGEKQPSEEEVHAQAVKEAETLDQAVEKGASTVPQPPHPGEADQEGGEEGLERPPGPSRQASATFGAGGSTEKKKPKKLQVRSGNEVAPPPERKKPKKLEVRSSSERKENV